MVKTNQELQNELDVSKWRESEIQGRDMCKSLSYCEYCEGEPEYPCAKAYRRAQKAQKVKATSAAPKKTTVRKKK